MPITSSQIVEDRAQADGRRSVRERHTDDLGETFHVSYLAEAGANVSAIMSGRVAVLEGLLKEAEIARNVSRALDGFTNGFTFRWSTANENLAAMRELYRTATKWELLTLAHVLHHQNLSNAQIDGLFGTSNNTQRTAVRDKLAALDAKYHDVLDDAGD